MWQKALQYVLAYLVDKIISLITGKWEEYQEDEERKKDVKKKVKAIKEAKSKDELRIAIRDLSI